MTISTFIEPILKEDNSRYVLFPIKYPPIFALYKKAMASFWTPEEISFNSRDLKQWEDLDDNTKFFLSRTLAFFSSADGVVMENLASRFCREIAIPEAKHFYAFQLAMEGVHSETYSLLIDTYIKDSETKRHLFNAMDEIPCIKKKADWAIRYIQDENVNFAMRLIAFSIVEGVFFSGSFASIYYVKEMGILDALTFSNELISRDESLHTDFAVCLFGYIQDKPCEEQVHEMFKEAIAIEIEFITDSIPCSLLGLNMDLMSDYIKFVADRLLVQLGYSKLWNIHKCPLEFMDKISLEGKTNFFDNRVSEYSLAAINNEKKLSFELGEEDF
jgi:ribonucleoside-diphosphate reductase subunit M2